MNLSSNTYITQAHTRMHVLIHTTHQSTETIPEEVWGGKENLLAAVGFKHMGLPGGVCLTVSNFTRQESPGQKSSIGKKSDVQMFWS